MKKVIITGSTGMIGLALTKYLIANDIHVTMIIRKNSSKLGLIPDSKLIDVVECNLTDMPELTLSEDYEYLFHLGWEKAFGIERNNYALQLENVRYTLFAVELAKRCGCKKFIGIGSQAEYGNHEQNLSINTSCNPITGYGIAKFCAGQMAKLLCLDLFIQFNWIRVLSVYGEHDNPNTLIAYVKNCFSNNISPEVTKCEQIWDYISADEAVKIIFLIAKNGENGFFYPLGSGIGRPLKAYLEDIKLNMNSKMEIKYGSKEYPKNQVMHLVADMSYLEGLI